MKKYFIITLLGLAATIGVKAQEYKVNKTSGKIQINIPSVTVEGYNGNEVIFSSETKEHDADPLAKGLQAINGNGLVDNSGLGISVVEKAGTLEVNSVSTDLDIKIMVPKGLLVSYEFHKAIMAGKVHFKNLANEIVINVDYNKVDLDNVSGPVTVRALYGGVDAKFVAPIKGPISITSIYAAVDVAIPVDTKANVKLSSPHSNILASSELKIELEKNASDDMTMYGGEVKGKLNGGGIDFKLNSEYGKIYLRKAK